MNVVRVAEGALEVQFGRVSTPHITRQIRLLQHQLETQPRAGFLECVPAFVTLTVFFEGPFEPLRDWIEHQAQTLTGIPLPPPRLHRIPVHYAGPDLAEVCRLTGLDADTVVKLHAQPTYTVQMVGFMPGFPYLSGLDARLTVPRRSEPRLKVSAGSVGLAGPQTGIYPLDLPGGWQIIGHTTVRLFDAAATPPALLQAGDQVQFVPEE